MKTLRVLLCLTLSLLIASCEAPEPQQIAAKPSVQAEPAAKAPVEAQAPTKPPVRAETAPKTEPEAKPSPRTRPTRTRSGGRPTRWVNPLRREIPGVEHKTYRSESMGVDIGYLVYTPPDYATSSKRYPVIYWCHGSGGNETGPGSHVLEYIGKAISEKKVDPVIVISVNGGRMTGYTDNPEQKIFPETAIIKELIPLIDRTYRTIPTRRGRAIEGFSMGGAGAIKFAFKYPHMFGSVVSYAGAMGYRPGKAKQKPTTRPAEKPRSPRWKGAVYTLARQNADKIRGKLPIRLVVGTKDPTLKYNEPFRKLLDELDIDYEYELLEGLGHKTDLYYEAVGLKGLRFHQKVFSTARRERMRPDDTKARKMLEEYGKQVPDFPDIAYGDHERNKLDLYLAKSDTPTPVVIHIHGGGFRGGNKSGARASIIALCRQSGISVVPINYRLTKHATYPAQMHDAARAVQFLRHNAKRWNLDPKRFAATGGSAGGGISLWLACHDDLADPDSDDPVARQSTRLTCAAVINTQSTYDPREMDKLLGPTQDGTPRMLSLYGLNPEEADTPEAHKMYVDASAAPHVSADDPPVFMMYSHPNTPITSETTRSQKIHHPVFGDYLKSKMDPLGIECIVRYGTDYPGDNKDEKIINADPDIVRFFRRQFKIDQ